MGSRVKTAALWAKPWLGREKRIVWMILYSLFSINYRSWKEPFLDRKLKRIPFEHNPIPTSTPTRLCMGFNCWCPMLLKLWMLERRTPVAKRNLQVRFLAKSIILSTLFVLGLSSGEYSGEGHCWGHGKEVWNCSGGSLCSHWLWGNWEVWISNKPFNIFDQNQLF